MMARVKARRKQEQNVKKGKAGFPRFGGGHRPRVLRPPDDIFNKTIIYTILR